MFEAGYEALILVLQPERLLWMTGGVAIGLGVGILPGLGGMAGMAVLLPFIYGMDRFSGIALLMGMAAVVHTSDTFPSVLLGVPGSGGSQATIMDGYPLAKQGQGARALSAAFVVSMVGGLVGAVILFSLISVARPLILALGSPELFIFAMLGLSMVGILAKGAPAIGVLSGLAGVMLGLVGMAPQVSELRFTFDSLYLFDGIPLPVLALGLFALPEMMDLLIEKRSISQAGELKTGRLDGIKDAVRHKWLVLRSASMGAVLGMVPGVGGSVIDWLAYGFTKQFSRNTENFGKGDIRGVIGPESANNAKEGGTLVPTLLFGIPGSGTAAMLLGGLLLMGIQTGPDMVDGNLDITLSIIWTLALANVLGAGACFLLSGPIAKVSLVRASRLVPFLLIIMTVAAYQSTRHVGDIISFLVIGVVGWIMKQTGFPRPPLLIGFVLAASAERYLHLSMSRYGFEWLTRPIVAIVGLFIITLVTAAQVLDFRARRRARRASTDVPTPALRR